MVLEFIKQLAPSILARRKLSGNCTDADIPKYNQKRMQRYIMNELNKVKINPKSVGYQYLIVSVIRAMQNAIERSWRSSDTDTLLTYYTAPINSAKGYPTITEFVCFYANKLNNEY